MTFEKTEVTEADFRKPEFRTARVEDYEFDPSGELVRKDRFQTAMYKIASLLELSHRTGWTCEQVVSKVDELVERMRDVE